MMNNKEAVILAGKGGGGGGSGTDSNAVHYTAETKSDSEKAAARANIGAEPERFIVTITKSGSTISAADKTFAEILAALADGKICEIHDGDAVAYLSNTDKSTQADFTTVIGEAVCLYQVESDDSWTYAETPIVMKTVAITGATPSITPHDNCRYKCGELTSLTITDPPSTGEYSIIFTSGSTATTLTMPQSVIMPDSFSVTTNTRYEINVSDGYAVCNGWAVSSS